MRKGNFRTNGTVIQKTTYLGWESGRGGKYVQSDTKSDALAEKINFRTKGAVIQKTTYLGWKTVRGRKYVQSDTKKWRISWEKAISVRKAPYSNKLRI